ncbi:hypothetical protein SLS56_009857 [Neofusicoccum ribis]|uniref:Uncharacterized protein n=1 Tax=Neofusicoccum ribis TaxID=45134 RepID=A0ABR3SG25_9PEZI
MSDADGDSTMHSSPNSSPTTSEDLFPGSNPINETTSGGVALPTLPTLPTTAAAATSTPAAAVPSTPTTALASHSELSPPSSQGASANTSATRTAAAAADAVINENGKRVLPTGLNFGSASRIVPAAAADDGAAGAAEGGGGGAVSGGKRAMPGVHAASGYRWEREAEAPGWGWKNKKAQEEWAKAEEGLVERERMVKARYGDPLEERRGSAVGVKVAG